MLIVMSCNAQKAEIDRVIKVVQDMGFRAEPVPGGELTAIGVLGNKGLVDDTAIRDLPGVQEIIHVSRAYKLVARDFHPRGSIINVCGVDIGEGRRPVVIAGPCAVEGEEQIVKAALAVKAAAPIFYEGAPISREPDLTPFKG